MWSPPRARWCTPEVHWQQEVAYLEDGNAIDVVEELLDQWPDPADLRYVREGPDGHLLPLT